MQRPGAPVFTAHEHEYAVCGERTAQARERRFAAHVEHDVVPLGQEVVTGVAPDTAGGADDQHARVDADCARSIEVTLPLSPIVGSE